MELTKTEKIVYRYLISEDISEMSASQIAKKLYVSRPTIYRVCNKMGYQSFTHLKYAKEQKKHQKSYVMDVDSTNMFDFVDEDQLIPIIDKILVADHIFVIGTHATAIAAKFLCRQLLNLNCLAIQVEDEFELAQLKHMMSEKDLLFCLSTSGENTIITNNLSEIKSQKVGLTKKDSTTEQLCNLAITFDFSVYHNNASFDRENIFPILVIIQKILLNTKKVLDMGV